MSFDSAPVLSKIQNLRSKISDARILLWDIDGTMTFSTRPGTYKEYFRAALERVYGSAGDIDNVPASGMTDTQITYEALRGEGFTVTDIFARLDDLLKVFHEEMSRVVASSDDPYGVFPGVREALAAAHDHPLLLNSLLTGNLSCAAEIKLRHVDLWKYFEFVPHTFGEISHDRRDLAHEAGKRINEFLGAEVKPAQFIVIGDTPNDIDCARAFGARSVAIATGRNHSAEELSSHKPDLVLNDLTDTKEVIRVFETI
jgi:phosphoglycolate phosphatase-like HAD superfamily hydrolase